MAYVPFPPGCRTTDPGPRPLNPTHLQDARLCCEGGRPSGTVFQSHFKSISIIPASLLTEMFLPPELIDRILKSLRDDPRSLIAASLVSKAWTSWSQAYLFESAHLMPRNLHRWQWLQDAPQGVNSPTSHTRTLTLEEYRLSPWINPQYLYFSLSSLASFRDVRSLSLLQWNATLFNGASPEPYFGHFGKSLRALSLRFCTLDPANLFGFLSLLPNVQDLEIAYLYPHHATLDTIPDVPKVTPSFCGTLSLADLSSGHLTLKALAALPLHFTTIRIRGCTFNEPDAYQLLLTSCRETLISLRFEKSYRGVLECFRGSPTLSSLSAPPDRPIPDVSLASCDKLEEVHALLRSSKSLPRSLITLLSSITSQNLRKISLTFMETIHGAVPDRENEDSDDSDDWNDETETWGSLDTTLGRLAKQVSQAEGKLALEFDIQCMGSEPVKFNRLLSQFLEYGDLDIRSTQTDDRRRTNVSLDPVSLHV